MDDAELVNLLLDQMTDGKNIVSLITNTDKRGAAQQTLAYLNSRLTLLDNYWSEVYSRNRTLCRHEAKLKDEAYFKEMLYATYEYAYSQNKSELLERIEAKTPPRPASAAIQSPMQLVSAHSSLPRISLPKFSGKQADWETFQEQFTALVSNDTSLSAVVKLRHLQSCVEGAVAQRVKRLPEIGSNFTVGWDILVKRYDNPRIRITTHMRKLLSMPAAKKKDDWFVEIVTSRLDEDTKEDWDKSIEDSEDLPTYAELTTFLERRVRTLELAQPEDCLVDSSSTDNQKNHPKTSKRSGGFSSHLTTSTQQSTWRPPFQPQCPQCSEKHFLHYCPTFISWDVPQRRAFVKNSGLCSNCLRQGHATTACTSTGRCRVYQCGEPHHSSIHPPPESSNIQSSPVTMRSTNTMTTCISKLPMSQGNISLLATATITLESPAGHSILVRALIDPASEGSFITERLQALSISKTRIVAPISGVGGNSTLSSKAICEVVLKSKKEPNFSLKFPALVLGKLTALLPRETCVRQPWLHLEGIDFADPDFCTPARIDCLLGADVYSYIIREGLRMGQPNEPIAQNTALGWVITGTAPAAASKSHHRLSFFTTASISTYLQKFWEQEEVSPPAPRLSKDEEACEKHFMQTHSRDETGRFVVRLPFAKSPHFRGSQRIAISRFIRNEKRLESKPALANKYAEFMQEFIDLNHMEEVPNNEIDNVSSYYMTHHAVEKSDGSGKIRVVCNASQPDENNNSINKYVHTGRKLQTGISTIVSRCRFFPVIFTADIVKMYRQFRIHDDDKDWLRLVWRPSASSNLKHFRMLRVIYGLACAPYQAIRALLKLAEDGSKSHPKAAAVLQHHIYVDDVLAGADTVEEALEIRNQLTSLLDTAGLELSKWSSNTPALIPPNSASSLSPLSLSETEFVPTLGLLWNPLSDTFSFNVTPDDVQTKITKRVMLSELSRLFDPLGWLAPITVICKLLLQQLWISGAGWDDPVDDATLTSWIKLHSQLKDIEQIRIPRWVNTLSNSKWYLHGFSDSSQRAYAAVVYLVVCREGSFPQSYLMTAKSKVAPLKTQSIPRLELCGALLLTRLLVNTINDLLVSPIDVFCWTDSQVTLAWLSGHPSRWNVYVGNRTSEIISAYPAETWGHVRSAENPADLATKGVSPEALQNNALWWHGPNWLRNDWESWERHRPELSTIEEQKTNVAVFATSNTTEVHDIELRISRASSSWKRLQRAVAYIRRWKAIACHRTRPSPDFLSVDEVEQARIRLIRAVQLTHFGEEIKSLTSGTKVSHSSKIAPFTPFLDNDGILRLGGRLQNTHLSFDEKHPIIIPQHSHLATLIIWDAHRNTLHGGPQLTQSYLLRSFWIIHGHNQTRKIIRQCVKCTRFRGKPLQQLMAPLPKERVTPATAFTNVGLDCAGPFMIRTSKGRGQKAYKGYVAVFICLASRGVHLEVVSDLTSQGFLQAFERFIYRRGVPHSIFSDNATTFHGADAEIRRLFAQDADVSNEVIHDLASQGVRWRFIPPRALHFGGIWEAAVKSFKSHLRYVVAENKLTFEEFSTLAAQIEACLNSRPISPFSSDPRDVTAITPGHIILGKSLLALPVPYTETLPTSGTARYRIATQMRNHFWKRWQKEALHHLQRRSKWLTPTHDIVEGDLVLIIDDQCPPHKWPLARVITCHPAPDDNSLTRVLTLKTPTSTFQRPLVKVIRLPLDQDFTSTPPGQLSEDDDCLPDSDGPLPFTAGGAEDI